MQHLGTVDHQLCGSHEQLYPQYCRLLTSAFMRGGAIDYYSNNVQVAPDGALAKVGVKSNVQILQVNNDTVSNWDELTDAVEKATKDNKTTLN